MSEYPAKLVEKVRDAIIDADWSDSGVSTTNARNMAIAALDSIPYAAMREALEQALIYLRLDCEWDTVALVESALRTADGE